MAQGVNLSFFANTTDVTGNITTGTFTVTNNLIVSSGSVGIGTNSPISGANVSLTANGCIAVKGFLTADQTSTGIVDYFASTTSTRFLSYGPVGTVSQFIWLAGSGGAAPSERMRIDSSGNVGIGNTPSGTYKLQVTGLISDSKGDVRAAPIQSTSSAYVLVATNAGQTISITTGGVTVNASIFSAGDMVSIFNNSGSSQTITQGASVTLRLSGTATTGSRTLAQYGVATLLCVTGGATPTFACSGAGLT